MGTVYLFRGKAATGKTTLSNRLSQKLAIPVFRKDDITDALKTGGYLTDRAAGNAVCYDILCRMIQTNLDLGADFIVDLALGDRGNAAFFLNRLDFKQNRVFRFFLDCSDEEAWKQRHLARLKNPLLHESFQSLEHVLEHYRQADIGPMEGEYVIDSANPIDECFAEISRVIAPDQAGHGI